MFTRVVELTSESGKARELSPRRIVRALSVGHPLAYPRMPATLSIRTHDDWSALGFKLTQISLSASGTRLPLPQFPASYCKHLVSGVHACTSPETVLC